MNKLSLVVMQLPEKYIRRILTFRAKTLRLELGLRSKRRNSPYSFQVVHASLPTKACLSVHSVLAILLS